LFNEVSHHFKKYNTLPEKDILIKMSQQPDKIKEYFNEIESIDFNLAKNYEFLKNETNLYLKEQALKNAILKSVDLIDKQEDTFKFRQIVEDALCKDINIDLGTNYWESLKERLTRIFNNSEVRVPSFYPALDEFISGGFPPYTLNVFLARIHGFKSSFLVNMATRLVLNKYSPVILTLEMSEDAICQRIDSILSGMDINRMYLSKSNRTQLVSSLTEIKKNNNLGQLIVKEFPTGAASVTDFYTFLRELQYRGIKPNPIFVDYINLMKPENKSRTDLYQDVKSIAEQLRAMSLTFNTPIISVSQLNRGGMTSTFEEVDFTDVAESAGLPATADSMFIFGQDEDALVYQSELHYKIVKNRLGGRVGEKGKMFVDKKSLKMYDATELQLWIDDAKKTGDKRDVYKSKS
jgi:hypothetical protein